MHGHEVQKSFPQACNLNNAGSTVTKCFLVSSARQFLPVWYLVNEPDSLTCPHLQHKVHAKSTANICSSGTQGSVVGSITRSLVFFLLIIKCKHVKWLLKGGILQLKQWDTFSDCSGGVLSRKQKKESRLDNVSWVHEQYVSHSCLAE